MARDSESGLPVRPAHGPSAPVGRDREGDPQPGRPGTYPFARGVCPTMCTDRPWTTRRYAAFGTAGESNARYRRLIADGATELSVTFDLPTRMGHDSDAPIASGEVGRAGVAIDSVDDMRVLFDGIPLDEVSTSMTIDAPAAPLLLLYQLVGEEQGVPAEKLSGTTRNDVPEEHIARGTRFFPPGPSLRLAADILTYCQAEIPKWNIVPACGHHGYESHRVGPAVEARQAERLAKLRAWRCGERVAEALVRMERAAVGEDNVLYPMKDALAAGATVGEVCDTLRGIWGTYPPMGRCRLIGGPPERPPLAGGRPPEPPAGWAIPR